MQDAVRGGRVHKAVRHVDCGLRVGAGEFVPIGPQQVPEQAPTLVAGAAADAEDSKPSWQHCPAGVIVT